MTSKFTWGLKIHILFPPLPIYRRQRPPVNASTNIDLFGNNTSYKAATSIKTTPDKISIQYNILIPWQLTNRAGIQLSFKYAAIYKKY